MIRVTEWIVIRQVSTNELRLVRIIRGYKPPPDPDYTWGGPYPSKKAAEKAIWEKREELRRQLYGD